MFHPCLRRAARRGGAGRQAGGVRQRQVWVDRKRLATLGEMVAPYPSTALLVCAHTSSVMIPKKQHSARPAAVVYTHAKNEFAGRIMAFLLIP